MKIGVAKFSKKKVVPSPKNISVEKEIKNILNKIFVEIMFVVIFFLGIRFYYLF